MPWRSVPRDEELRVTSDALAITGMRSQACRAWWHEVLLQLVSWVPPTPCRSAMVFVFFFSLPHTILDHWTACGSFLLWSSLLILPLGTGCMQPWDFSMFFTSDIVSSLRKGPVIWSFHCSQPRPFIKVGDNEMSFRCSANQTLPAGPVKAYRWQSGDATLTVI